MPLAPVLLIRSFLINRSDKHVNTHTNMYQYAVLMNLLLGIFYTNNHSLKWNEFEARLLENQVKVLALH